VKSFMETIDEKPKKPLANRENIFFRISPPLTLSLIHISEPTRPY